MRWYEISRFSIIAIADRFDLDDTTEQGYDSLTKSSTTSHDNATLSYFSSKNTLVSKTEYALRRRDGCDDRHTSSLWETRRSLQDGRTEDRTEVGLNFYAFFDRQCTAIVCRVWNSSRISSEHY